MQHILGALGYSAFYLYPYFINAHG